jgi:hypothetical protein
MDLNNPVIQLCIEGTQAEYAGRQAEACALYGRAWEIAKDDYDACIAAHYLARCQETAAETLRWNQIALARADAVDDDRIRAFYPSLYLSLGRAYELMGDFNEAQRYYDLSADLGYPHQAG